MFNSVVISNVGAFPQIISNPNDRYCLKPHIMGNNNPGIESATTSPRSNNNNNNYNNNVAVANSHSMPNPPVHNMNITHPNPNFNIPYLHTTTSNNIDLNYIPPISNIYSSSATATTSPIILTSNSNNNNNTNNNNLHNTHLQSMSNAFQRKYETLLPASKPTVTNNTIENDMKSRLNASALKFLSGTESGLDSAAYTYLPSLASSNRSSSSNSSVHESFYHYDIGNPLPVITAVNSASSSHNNSITSMDPSETINNNVNVNGRTISNSLPVKKEESMSPPQDVWNVEEKPKRRNSAAKTTRKRPYKTRRGRKRKVETPKSIEKTAEVLEHSVYLELRRRHICQICNKGFTTSGHLARHNRIHTGERNHICPFEGCHQKFSRQDNCLQHYKTHLKRLERSEDPISGDLITDE
ncbi:hypothetical protein MOUN0_J03136 [Monosporozyma unispora]